MFKGRVRSLFACQVRQHSCACPFQLGKPSLEFAELIRKSFDSLPYRKMLMVGDRNLEKVMHLVALVGLTASYSYCKPVFFFRSLIFLNLIFNVLTFFSPKSYRFE